MCRPYRTAAVLILLAACQPADAPPEEEPREERVTEESARESAGRETQVARAVLAAPESLRPGAAVLGYDGSGDLVTLRQGTNPLVCLADDPVDERFRIACYHESLEPLMARGRELRASGLTGSAVDSARFAEIEAGTLAMPDHPAALYNLSAPAPPGPESDEVPDAERSYVLYVPGARPGELGLPERPQGQMPWLMQPGTPKAHVMFTP